LVAQEGKSGGESRNADNLETGRNNPTPKTVERRRFCGGTMRGRKSRYEKRQIKENPVKTVGGRKNHLKSH